MENQEIKQEEVWQDWEKSHKRGKICGGIFIVIVGSLFLAKELGAQIPEWVFTWKMLLIAMGLISGVKHSFRHPSWIILVLVGGAFLIGDIFPGIAIKPILWPILIIAFGLFLIFKPRRKFRHRHWGNWQDKHQQYYSHKYYKRYGRHYSCEPTDVTSSEDYIDSTSFMGGVKKNIISKSFKGGDITNIFGGAEINLSQADFEGSATLDLTNIFGGTKLIIPAHWEIKSELVTVFGSIEDKRPIQPNTNIAGDKVLVLKGTTFFGGIDIKSY